MKITRVEPFLTNAGLRNYLFIRLTTDCGLSGIGEASLEWQEKTVHTLIDEWVADRVLGTDPFDIESVIGGMIRDQYQGGSTVMTAISGVEIAFWDIIGKACGQPVYKLLGGRCHERLEAYANGWYGGFATPREFAEAAINTVNRGYKALKFDPFGTAWKEMSRDEMDETESLVAAVRDAVGDDIELMIEAHGRLSVGSAIEIGRRLEKYRPAWYEEPVSPNSLDLLTEVKRALPFPIAAGERLYTMEDFYRFTVMRAADIVQMDPAHCGGLLVTKKIAAMAQAQDIKVSPHCSIGPVALCAALHVDWSTPNVMIQENFGDYDVPWRHDLVFGWNPVMNGDFALPEKPGLGIELNTALCAEHPYKKNSFPSLWDKRWLKDFTQSR
ncbi:MAG: mandelate racemase/muconate lactonizing enzyme family protein [Candidatus Poribacteria bacterium]|nr:mandelate racemase/muconate lactonizing enzyme family protein [Candidatus Poribacteria bacterium]MDE0506019.1 mandelate racemase/muconate lactonizing enzyme family protein [Candidatus Poribacteria bacterium]